MAATDPQDQIDPQMPANLRPIAVANLQREDTTLARTNAVFAAQPSPAVTPSQSTPEDQTSLNVAAAMSRGDAFNRGEVTITPRFAPDTRDIMNRVIDERMNMIAQGYDPDRPAMYVNPKRSEQLQREFISLGRQKQQNAFIDARMAHLQVQDQQHINAASDFTDFANGLGPILANTKPGSPEREQAILQHVTAHPDGAMTSAGRELLRTIATDHDTAAVTSDRIKAAQTEIEKAGFTPSSVEVTSKGGIVFRGGTEKQKPTKLESSAETDLAKAGLRPDEFSSRTNVRRGRIDPSTKKFDNQYTGAAKGDTVALDIGGETFTMPADQFNKLNRVYPQATDQTQSTGTTAPTKYQYEVGKTYKDSNGNTATYLGDGKWK